MEQVKEENATDGNQEKNATKNKEKTAKDEKKPTPPRAKTPRIGVMDYKASPVQVRKTHIIII